MTLKKLELRNWRRGSKRTVFIGEEWTVATKELPASYVCEVTIDTHWITERKYCYELRTVTCIYILNKNGFNKDGSY